MPRKPVKQTTATASATDASLALRVPDLSPKLSAKASNLYALGYSRAQVARRLGVQRASVSQALRRSEAAGGLPGIRKRLESRLEEIMDDFLAHKGQAPQKLTGYEFGVLYDRYALLRGEATQRIEIVTDTEERQRKVAELLAFARATPQAALPPASDEGGRHPPVTQTVPEVTS